ncbi:MAG: aminopeptidase [Phycisphaerales bacterium]|nr:aminopeptidase [Phycisphaerales bacterium]
MLDVRYTKLANTLIHYSCAVKAGENVLIEAIDIPHDFTKELIRLTVEAGGRPIVLIKSNEIERALRMNATREQFELIARMEKQAMERVDCYLGIRGNANVSEISDVPTDKQKIYESTVWNRVHRDIRVARTRWCVLRWPTASMAQMAEMSTEAFEDYFFNVCTLDYAKMSRAMLPLRDLMQRTDRVRIKGPRDTDLTFSIKNIPARLCDGHRNIPDGEVFTAPVHDSVNGIIHYNCPSLYRGVTHNDVRLTFKNGKIVDATSNNTAHLNEVFDTDEGSRYVGEFAIGFNPYCTKPMKDILFDEKIAGSIHFTPGACYDTASNGNHSAIHWDLVLRQTPETGGGQIYFDNKLIREDGRFVPKELHPLNPENLK